MLITYEEACARSLPGCDVFRYSHLIYKDENHRNWGAVFLNIEAYYAFKDTILLSKYHEMQEESRETINIFRNNAPYISTPFTTKFMRHKNLENAKLGIAFELHLKARLLERGYLLHVIDKDVDSLSNLAHEQKKKPISIQEFFEIEQIGYYFNGQENILIGLKDQSITFSDMFQKRYKRVLELPASILSMISEFRKLRNQIHLPGDAFNISYNVEGIFEFINHEIVRHSNDLVREYDLPTNMILEEIRS